MASPTCSPIHKALNCFHDDSDVLNLDFKLQEKAEAELGETPERRREAVTALNVLLLNDRNLNIPKENGFMLRFLRARKFDPKKSFRMIQRYYLMKMKCPELFKCPLPSGCETIFDLQSQYMLPDRDQHGRRVYIIRVEYFDSGKVTIDEIFRANVLALEQIAREPETQISGLVVILDMSGLSLNHAKFFTPYYAKKTVELVQETFPLRFKGFHVVNEPFYFDAIMTMLKPFLKEKMKNRIFLHGNDVGSLHKHVKHEILPKEYGGGVGYFDNKRWYLELLAEEEYFKRLDEFGYKTE